MKPGVLQLRPTQRRWRDLTKRRLSLGLVAAPVPSVAIGILLIFMVDSGTSSATNVAAGIGVIFAAAISWSLLVGWVYLLIVVRWRGLLSRTECLLLGILAACALPGVAESVSTLVDALTIGFDTAATEPWDIGPATLYIGIILSIALAPFGLLGGWIFWRLGVRPTVTTVGDVAPVFD